MSRHTKSNIVSEIFNTLYSSHKNVRFSKTLIQLIVDSFLESTSNALKNGKEIELRGFGTFILKERKEKLHARNPRTGKQITVPKHTVVLFKAGKDLQSSVWDADHSLKDNSS